MSFDHVTLLPPEIFLKEGRIDKDGWISPRIVLGIEKHLSATHLEIILWNPDFSVLMRNNSVTASWGLARDEVQNVQLDDRVQFILQLGPVDKGG